MIVWRQWRMHPCPATLLVCALLTAQVFSTPLAQDGETVSTPTTSCENAAEEETTEPVIVNHKKSKKARSTSSSSGDNKKDDESDEKNSLSMSADSGSDESGKSKGNHKKYYPKSTEERHGWRKWHRKCTRCLEDEKKKWRDPSINWICGAYQRARRSFKSECMMHYRNCQDGTMFVKIHDHRCPDSEYNGDHFMYDYRVVLTDDSSSSGSDSSSSSEDSSSSESSKSSS